MVDVSDISPENPLLSLSATKEMLGVSHMTVYRNRRKGMFPEPVIMNDRPFWKLSDVQAWLHSQQQKEVKS